MQKIERFMIFEVLLEQQKSDRLPFAVFMKDHVKIKLRGFQINETQYAVRFMPQEEGIWTYTVQPGDISGKFECCKNIEKQHICI